MRAIVNLSTPKYKKGQERLDQSLSGKTNADILLFKSEQAVGSPTHQENNYAFKIYAIQRAIDFGYTSILWLDASMYVIGDLEPIFKVIESQGYFFQDSGWMNTDWTNQRTRDYFGTCEGKQFSSGVLGLDFTSQVAIDFFEKWKKAMLDGQFNGSHTDHRHDQSIGSIIANIMGLKIHENNTYWQYSDIKDNALHNEISIIANGIC